MEQLDESFKRAHLFFQALFCFIVSVKASVMCTQADMLLNIVGT